MVEGNDDGERRVESLAEHLVYLDVAGGVKTGNNTLVGARVELLKGRAVHKIEPNMVEPALVHEGVSVRRTATAADENSVDACGVAVEKLKNGLNTRENGLLVVLLRGDFFVVFMRFALFVGAGRTLIWLRHGVMSLYIRWLCAMGGG